jgi:SAM-dependent methyltransferase
MDLKDKMDQIYSNSPLDKIPWNIKEPPRQLINLVEENTIAPCRTADVGCGVGNYAIWFAKKGFQVTGIDFSVKAVELARINAEQQGVDCVFEYGDLTNTEFRVESRFQFVYDWEVLHHVFPDDRQTYFQNVANLLEDKALYYSVCLSEDDPDFGGKGKYRETPIETKLYFSSEKEIEQLLVSKFNIRELTTAEITGKYGPHKAVIVLAEKKES